MFSQDEIRAYALRQQLPPGLQREIDEAIRTNTVLAQKIARLRATLMEEHRVRTSDPAQQGVLGV
jgi:hypothetical protein